MEKLIVDSFSKKSFNTPDETAEFPAVSMESVKLGNLTVHRVKCEPGWRWTDSFPELFGTDTCEFEHPLWMVLKGRFVVQMDDGRTQEYGPGDLGMIPPGHDAWVVGDEPVLAIDIQVIGA